MLQMLINSLILLGSLGIPVGALFWKHFARRPKEFTRAFVATIVGTLGLIVFFLQVAVMTTKLGENLITMLITWLGW
jgi:hypothetical protein